LVWSGGRAEVTPPWQQDTVYLVFPLSGTPTGLHLVPQTKLGHLTVESVEWLLPGPP
jgi:hypothetical protein